MEEESTTNRQPLNILTSVRSPLDQDVRTLVYRGLQLVFRGKMLSLVKIMHTYTDPSYASEALRLSLSIRRGFDSETLGAI